MSRDPPPKKPSKDVPVEGIDLNDFEDDDRKVAGLNPDEAPQKPAAPPPPAQAPAPAWRAAAPKVLELPEADSSSLTSQALRAGKAPAAPPPPPPAPPPKVTPKILDLPEADASALVRTQARSPPAPPRPQLPALPPAARPTPVSPRPAPAAPPPPVAPAPAPPPVVSIPPSIRDPAKPTAIAAPVPAPVAAPAAAVAPVPQLPAAPPAAPAPAPLGAATPGLPAPQAVAQPPPGYAYPPYPAPYSVFQPYGAPSPYGAPPNPYGAPSPYGQPAFYFPPPPQRPRVSETAEALLRLNAAALLLTGYFSLVALRHTFEAATGITDAPLVRDQATLGLQFFSYFLTVTEAILVGLAVAAGASALFRIRESRGEFFAQAPEFPRATLFLLGLAVLLPILVGVTAWVYLSGVQHSLPGAASITNLGLERLFDGYRYATFAVALAQLAAAFLVVIGLKGALSHLMDFGPRALLRQFAALFVLASAVNAAAVLVLNFTVLHAPVVGQPASETPELFLLLVGPAIGCIAGLRLRAYALSIRSEAEVRFKEKLAREKPA